MPVHAQDFRDVRYVFLDRDGVVNRKPSEGGYVTSWAMFEILPGVKESIRLLNASQRKVIVVTNQRGIALGLYSKQDLETIHVGLQTSLRSHGAYLDGIYYCPHDRDECNCRKPATGMFEDAFRDFPGASPANSVMIGDSASDMEAAERLGMRSIFINPDRQSNSADTARADSLREAVALYMSADSSLIT